jgi:hypothetical protein
MINIEIGRFEFRYQDQTIEIALPLVGTFSGVWDEQWDRKVFEFEPWSETVKRDERQARRRAEDERLAEERYGHLTA